MYCDHVVDDVHNGVGDEDLDDDWLFCWWCCWWCNDILSNGGGNDDFGGGDIDDADY